MVFVGLTLFLLNSSHPNRKRLNFETSTGEEGGYTPLIVKPGDDLNTTLTYCWRIFSYVPIEAGDREKIEGKIVLKPDERFPSTEFGTILVQLNGVDIATVEVKDVSSEIEVFFDPRILKEGDNLLAVKGVTFKGALYFSVKVYVSPEK